MGPTKPNDEQRPPGETPRLAENAIREIERVNNTQVILDPPSGTPPAPSRTKPRRRLRRWAIAAISAAILAPAAALGITVVDSHGATHDAAAAIFEGIVGGEVVTIGGWGAKNVRKGSDDEPETKS